MNKKYYIDSISDETLVKLIDETLRYEKNKENENLKYNIFKIVPIVVVLLTIFFWFFRQKT